MSLKTELEKQIRNREVFTYNELVSFCQVWGYKISNAERRLRELTNEKDIEAIRNKKGCITGYQMAEEQMSLFK